MKKHPLPNFVKKERGVTDLETVETEIKVMKSPDTPDIGIRIVLPDNRIHFLLLNPIEAKELARDLSMYINGVTALRF